MTQQSIPDSILALETSIQDSLQQGDLSKALEQQLTLLNWAMENLPLDHSYQAKALIKMSLILMEAGLCEEAITSAEKALEIQRAATEESPSNLAELASILTNLGDYYNKVQQHEKGLMHSSEAVKIRRAMKSQDPQSRFDLAISLNNLGSNYYFLGRHQEAVAEFQEAIDLARGLLSHERECISILAASLCSLGNCFRELGEPVATFASMEEAVTLMNDLGIMNQGNPQEKKMLASALLNLSVACWESGQSKRSLKALQDLLAMMRPLASQNQEMAELTALALQLLVSINQAMEKEEEIIEPLEELVKYSRQLSKSNPMFALVLGTSLVTLAAHYLNTGQQQAAKKMAAESVEYLSGMVSVSPELQPYLEQAHLILST